MDILAVGTGRCGTVSLTKWFNELFQINQIPAQAVHEYLSRDAYIAFDKFYKTGSEISVRSIASQLCQSQFQVIIGNGYANLLPYLTSHQEIILIHLQRRDKKAWIASSVRNAKYYPLAYQYYAAEIGLDHHDSATPRTAAFQVGEATLKEWLSWSLEEKLSWHYDYTHRTITKHSPLFMKSLHIYTEDLNHPETLFQLATLIAPNLHIPTVPKLNGHYFANIESYPPALRPFAQWLLGNLDWEKAVTHPSYLADYAMNRYETWIGWCESGRAQQICPQNALNPKEMRLALKESLPKLKNSLWILNKLYLKMKLKQFFSFLSFGTLLRHKERSDLSRKRSDYL